MGYDLLSVVDYSNSILSWPLALDEHVVFFGISFV